MCNSIGRNELRPYKNVLWIDAVFRRGAMYCAQLTTIAWWILFALPQGKRMKFYGYGSILRPVFDCLRVPTQQLFCPQRPCRTFCLGRVPEYTPIGKKPCALLRAIKALYYTFFRSCCTLYKMVSAIQTLFFRGGHAAFKTQHATHGCHAQPF